MLLLRMDLTTALLAPLPLPPPLPPPIRQIAFSRRSSLKAETLHQVSMSSPLGATRPTHIAHSKRAPPLRHERRHKRRPPTPAKRQPSPSMSYTRNTRLLSLCRPPAQVRPSDLPPYNLAPKSIALPPQRGYGPPSTIQRTRNQCIPRASLALSFSPLTAMDVFRSTPRPRLRCDRRAIWWASIRMG